MNPENPFATSTPGAAFWGRVSAQTAVTRAKINVATIQDPGNQSANRTRQGYARKRILKPAGRFFSGCGMKGEWA
jgi:hypothetical protein